MINRESMRPLGLLFGLIALGAAPVLTITEARIPAVPPGVDMLAAYFTIKNDSAQPLVLTGAKSPRFAHVSIHHSDMEGGMARMSPVTRLEIAPGATLRFAPGGYHLMLMNPKAAVQAGERIPLTLHFAGRAPAAFTATVSAPE